MVEDSEEIRAVVRTQLRRYGTVTLELASALKEVHTRQLYRGWGFKRFDEWLDNEGDGSVSRAQAYRLVVIGKVFTATAEDAEAVGAALRDGRIGMVRLTELAGAVERGEIGRADALAAATQAVSVEIGRRKQEFRSVTALPKELADLFEGARNVARFNICKDNPTETEVWEWIICTVRDMAEPLTHTTSDGIKIQWSDDAMLDGHIRCEECGTWDWSKLDPHHIAARSAANSVSPKKLIALLCRECHTKVQPRWREWAIEHGYVVVEEEVADVDQDRQEVCADAGPS